MSQETNTRKNTNWQTVRSCVDATDTSVDQTNESKRSIQQSSTQEGRQIILFFKHVLIFGATMLSVVVSVGVVVLHFTNFDFLFLELRSQRSNVSSQDHLLSGSQLAEAAFYFTGDWIDHFDVTKLMVLLLLLLLLYAGF